MTRPEAKPDSEHVRNVLVWGAERVGDVVMTFPALKLIRERLPEARITFVTTDYAEDVLRLSGLADVVLTYRFKHAYLNSLRYRRVRRLVRSGAFDRIFIFGKSTKYQRQIGSLAGAFNAEDEKSGHQAERCARAVMAGLGMSVQRLPDPRIDVPDLPEISQKLASRGLDVRRDSYLAIHPGSNRVMRSSGADAPARLWPPEKHCGLIEKVRESLPDLKIVIVGTRQERPWLLQEIELNLADRGNVLNLAGETSLAELLQLLKHARLLVCCDSGVMHLGTVAGTPIVAIFGPSDENFTGPFGMGDLATVVRACPRAPGSHGVRYMDLLTVDQVFAAVREKLRRPA